MSVTTYVSGFESFTQTDADTFNSGQNKYFAKVVTPGSGYSGSITQFRSDLDDESLTDYTKIEKDLRVSGKVILFAQRMGNRKCPPA